MAVGQHRKISEAKYLTLNDTLTSGITKVDSSKRIVQSYEQYQDVDTGFYVSKLVTNSLKKTISADAALAFGEQIATFPLGLIMPISGYVTLTSLTATGLSATAGEVGLGTTIASGAVATLGGTPGFEDIMEGTTLANHVAATTLTSHRANLAPRSVGTTATHGVQIFDGSATAKKIHLNLASTWDQTAAEAVTFSAEIRITWRYIGAGA